VNEWESGRVGEEVNDRNGAYFVLSSNKIPKGMAGCRPVAQPVVVGNSRITPRGYIYRNDCFGLNTKSL
jgi:hypothetical protein